MTIAQLLREATTQLAPVTETPRLDAEILLAHTLGLSRARLLSRLQEPAESHPRFDAIAPRSFEALLRRRMNHEPIAYILGSWEFFSMEFSTRAPILVPRPETEHLVEAALQFLSPDPARVLDLCTGTGCVAIAIAKHAANVAVTATDLNPAALALAAENSARHGVTLVLHGGDLFEALPAEIPPFDVITANPPYVPDAEWEGLPAVIRMHEDARALLAGADGLDFVRRIAAEGGRFLRPGGLLALEIGEDQFDSAAAILAAHGFAAPGFIKDLGGIRRIIHARR